jgi:hypothetical protein
VNLLGGNQIRHAGLVIRMVDDGFRANSHSRTVAFASEGGR